MKKLLFTIFIFNIMMTTTFASNKIPATLSKCVDGDTAYFIVDNQEVKVRFLAIDTPESTNKKEPFGKVASEYTCNMLTSASKIEVATDDHSSTTDKYGRSLYWIFVDGELLQDKIIQEGLGKVAYLYGDYQYTTLLQASQTKAKLEKKGIWQEVDVITPIIITITTIILIIILCIGNKKYRKKIFSKAKRKIKKEIQKQL